ncbi:hypothetical protein [Thermomonospora umbrina]|uniref:hypothetical protein n=1 Tax=Thermomonospora umbrina TaxID=111806 RepID=UPI0011C117C4|nr:hypothetical protein [Thermomonospora umbrina]
MSDAEARILWDAEQILIRDCVARAGFRYWVPSYPPFPEGREFPYVLDDLDWARKNGYGAALRAHMRKADEADPNRRYLKSLPVARRRAVLVVLNGVGPTPGARGRRPDEVEAWLPTGGVVRRGTADCPSQAQRALYGDLAGWFRATRVTGSLTALTEARVLGDPRYGAAVRPWASCMERRGHPFATPARARTETLRTAPRHAEEVEVAVAEASCAEVTGLASRARSLEAEHAHIVTTPYRAEVVALRRLRLEALPRARGVVARG